MHNEIYKNLNILGYNFNVKFKKSAFRIADKTFSGIIL